MTFMHVMVTGNKVVPVTSYEEASKVCRAYLDKTGIGNTRWTGGALFEGEKQIGYVSYNGRVWSGRAQDWQPGMVPLWDNRTETV